MLIKRDEFSAVAWKVWGIQHIYNIIIIISSSTNKSTNKSNFFIFVVIYDNLNVHYMNRLILLILFLQLLKIIQLLGLNN